MGSTSQFFDALGDIRRLIDGAAGHQDVGSGMDALMAGVGVYAAVYLQLTRGVHGVDIAADGLHLGHHVGHELLAAEARLHRHDEHHIKAVEVRVQALNGRARL